MSEQITERGGSRIKLEGGKGDRYLVRLMGWEPGSDVVEGSSGDYPVAAIKRDFPESFPKGTRMKANHDGMCTEAGGDIRRIVAKIDDTPFPKEDGMYAHMRVSQEWSKSGFFEDFADVVGLSISAAVELEEIVATDDDGDPVLDDDGHPVTVQKRSERGAVIIKRFLTLEESPYNTVDIVEAPGADGRIVARAFESAKETFLGMTNIREQATFASKKLDEKNSGATPPRSTRKGNSMDEEERAALSAEITENVVKALKPAEPKQESTLGVTVEAVLEADLSKRGRAAVYKSIESGTAADVAISEQKALEDEIKAEFAAGNPTKAPAVVEDSSATFGYTKDEGAGLASKTQEDLDREFEELMA